MFALPVLAQALVGGSLIQLVITLVVLGVVLYVVETMLPIEPVIKRLIHIVVVLVVCLWLLRVFAVI